MSRESIDDARIGSFAARRSGGASEQKSLRAWMPTVIDWLHEPRADRFVRDVMDAPSSEVETLRTLMTIQGVAPLVAEVGAELAEDVFGARQEARTLLRWLRVQAEQNRVRLDRFASELTAILSAAHTAGFPVMPMKGAVSAFTRYREPGLRPMADLDLLVADEDESGLHDILVRLGYERTREHRRHRTYGRSSDRVVALDATHPDNPRRIEVHTRVRRSMFRELGSYDLTAYLWGSGHEGKIMGETAFLPSNEAHFSDAACHATEHMLDNSAKLLQWFDVAELGRAVPNVDDAYARAAFPAVALAARAFPAPQLSRLAADLARSSTTSMQRLVSRVPLDDRAGLRRCGERPDSLPWVVHRWRSWRPTALAVRTAFPRLPLPLAYAGYVVSVGTYAMIRAVRSASGSRR